jgi:hypothetical protein
MSYALGSFMYYCVPPGWHTDKLANYLLSLHCDPPGLNLPRSSGISLGLEQPGRRPENSITFSHSQEDCRRVKVITLSNIYYS